ncbi:erythromycin esterase family protein [Geoalkalibacter halelectricus]|uniref:Erythromycin esterase family protein n=1 Tax=Geoalkalibacter halelectricus TaxID=2847045 RepID=A0ABY5ZHZ2_9BACT|nr:erythromycin esterase family protein [Geoalkalibacter halelectricus]MDO3379357.1 erythromycin esterase family protein [Geoalkalibacter halelectricus]UWZ78765.1 erythromycin esterase family protein [Geoalkalibacter halelectricus]
MRYFLPFILFILPLCLGLPAAQAEKPEPLKSLRAQAVPLESARDLDPLLRLAKDRSLVLLGEASHGTSEFYTWRADISRRLIEEEGYRFIAVEGDWASLYRLNLYVRGLGAEGESARGIMEGFSRWPIWMWANEETAALIKWLREYNAERPAAEQVGFYGIDVYGPETSLAKVRSLVERKGADLAEEVAASYACLQPYAEDFSLYARAVAQGGRSCEGEARRVVALLREARSDLAQEDRAGYFNLKQNALVVKNAERHYRAMPLRGDQSWNHRVDHFYLTVERLLAHYGAGAQGIVWAHNTHIGDARATAMAAQGQRNIGQIARRQLGEEKVLAVGFGTHRGEVMAGLSWGAEPQVMRVPPAREGSFEDLLHRTEVAQLLLIFDDPEDFPALLEPLGHRAIGVVYDPRRERVANYVPSLVPLRYDAFIYLEETRALRPIP